jgi:hypothetical protein
MVRWCTGGVMLAAALLAPWRPAAAELTDDDGCRASGVWASNGMVVDADASGTITVPRADTVQWQGSVPGAPGEYHGSIWVNLPPPLGSMEIDSWAGTSSTTSTSGVEEYNLPKLVPAGVTFTVGGEHIDANGTCAGQVSFEIAGSPLKSPFTWVALGGTAVSGAGAFVLLRPLFRRVV